MLDEKAKDKFSSVIWMKRKRERILDAVPAIEACLKDQDRIVRQAAATALGAIKSVRSVTLLVSLWRNDPISVVREAAQEALNCLGNADDGGDEMVGLIGVTKILSKEVDSLLEETRRASRKQPTGDPNPTRDPSLRLSEWTFEESPRLNSPRGAGKKRSNAFFSLSSLLTRASPSVKRSSPSHGLRAMGLWRLTAGKARDAAGINRSPRTAPLTVVV